MLTFLLDNIGTIVVLLIVVAVVAAIIISHFRAKKKGKSSCGSCGCRREAGGADVHPVQWQVNATLTTINNYC